MQGRRLAAATLAVTFVLAGAGCTSWRASRLYQSGSHALEQGEVDRAVRDLSEAARLVPEASEVQNHLGLALLAAGDEPEALEAFERAVALDCDNQAASENLALVEARRAEREKRDQIDRAIGRVSRPRDRDLESSRHE